MQNFSFETIRACSKLPDLLLPWYAENARLLPWRQDQEPYHIWLSEIMLQQTRVETARSYYLRFLEEVPGIPELAALPEERLLKLWEGLGYYSRARNLQKAAKKILQEHGGLFPREHKEILALPGVGPYTAGAISSICFDQPRPAVDGNVLRLLSRLLALEQPIELPTTKTAITALLEESYPRSEEFPTGSCGKFTQALMEMGALVCSSKNPRCRSCPLAEPLCRAKAEGRVERFPLRLAKREKRREQRTVFLLQQEDKIALEQREEPGLLSGLWQLPNQSGSLSPVEALQQVEALGLQPLQLCRELKREHVFTHIIWEMRCYHILCAGDGGLCWAGEEELARKYALPTAFRIFLEAVPLFGKKPPEQAGSEAENCLLPFSFWTD
ncbi:MAG: A/G-specific adenine glycosylase [Bacillota bacterium]|nr:A/G-specific adenine glycosylase [Bacillota bacterium]